MATEEPLGPGHLERFLRASQIPGEIVFPGVPTPTVEAAAAAVGCEADDIVKSLLFLVDGAPVLVITCGVGHVDGRALAARFGVGRKKVKLADAATVLRESGYAVGAIPPFGHQTRFPTFLDRRVLDRPVVYAGGGADDALLRISPQVLLTVTQAELLEL
jgi:prolyl-tRNA editing enzyme YbaK/EbsC (Cys-tRNA(Pro) deacylase)